MLEENMGNASAKSVFELPTNVLKKIQRILNVLAEIGSAVASKDTEAALSTFLVFEDFYQTSEGLNL